MCGDVGCSTSLSTSPSNGSSTRAWTSYRSSLETGVHGRLEAKLQIACKHLNIVLFVCFRHYSSSPFLLKFLGSCTVALLLPCAILTSEYPSIRQAMGDRMVKLAPILYMSSRANVVCLFVELSCSAHGTMASYCWLYTVCCTSLFSAVSPYPSAR